MRRTKFFTSDLHLGHAKILKYCKRPFKDTHEMNSAIINNINNKVGTDDELYIVGDFSWGKANKYRPQINCKNITLIQGNHDKKKSVKSNDFSEIYHYLELRMSHREVFILCHYPLMSWNMMRYGSIHLHGHVHGTITHPHPNALDVGVDVHNFQPLSYDEIKACITQKSSTQA